MQIEFDGKVALIVGAAQGIGFATATELRNSGAKVAVADINGEAALAAASRLAGDDTEKLGVQADISSMDSVEAMVAEVTSQLGAPDIVIISAALLDDKLFLDSGPKDWQRIIDVCLYGPMNVLHSVLPGMTERGFGRIICMASDSARVGQARLSYYAAAKGGVIALIKSVAQEVGPSGVTLNVVSPGATDTELRQAREAQTKEAIGEERYAARTKKVVRMYPAGRIGLPQDHASMITYLASEQASWVTGQVISVNGGFVMP
ncbi:MAG: SDR family oxidoreductase [Rhodobacteraceae bacterium]|nr:SDR family oxidoreductase [Paracoccaceae bacterium]